MTRTRPRFTHLLLAVAIVFSGALPAVASTSSTSISISSSSSGSGGYTSITTTVDGVTTTTTDVWGNGYDYIEPEAGWDDTDVLPEVDTRRFFGSLGAVRSQIGMDSVRRTGRGIDIALIDTGVVPVDGLDGAGRVVNGPDLSFESQDTDLRYLDTFGHGTHMAGIIISDRRDVPGIAPDARLVNLKVAGHNGAVDVTQVLAAIDWVIQNRNSNGLNIRVLNLSYGTDSFNRADRDLLSFAVEQAWRAGIVVVAAGGNDGNEHRLTSPAYNPFVIAVGAADASLLGTANNPIPSFSNCGIGRNVDLVAPGRSIMSLRNPGSYSDTQHPEARSDDGRRFVGSGSSQAAAVVSGAVAVLLERRPHMSPDQVKRALVRSATPLPQALAGCGGAGMINVAAADMTSGGRSTNQWHTATRATGTLDATRGNHRVSLNGTALKGETDIFGQRFDVASWAARSASHTAWKGGSWNGMRMTGSGFGASSWAGLSWSGVSWSGVSWSGVSWSGVSWSGVSWSGVSWSGGTWSGVSWSGVSWSDASWG
jgi:serine protease AprX